MSTKDLINLVKFRDAIIGDPQNKLTPHDDSVGHPGDLYTHRLMQHSFVDPTPTPHTGVCVRYLHSPVQVLVNYSPSLHLNSLFY